MHKHKRGRYAFSLLGIIFLFGTIAIVPMTAGAPEAVLYTKFEPGKMPNQQVVTAAAKEAEAYLAALEIEHIPEPEPARELVPAPEAESDYVPPAPTPPPLFAGGGSPEVWMTAAGIDPADWGYVDFIATRESGWNPNATNSSSGACGLIQAHPCGKVPGSGYDPIDNLTWAKNYAIDRYGSWADAYDFWKANSWW